MADRKIALDLNVSVKGQEAVEQLDEKLNGAKKNTKEFGDNMKVTSKAGEALTNAIGSVNPQLAFMIKFLGSAKSELMRLITQFGLLRGAAIASGIGAFVVVLGSLAAFFLKTEQGSRMLNKALAAIGATVSVLIDRFAGFGEGLVEIFSGNFSKGAELLRNSIKGIGAEIANEAKQAASLSAALDKVRDREIELVTIQEKRRTLIADEKLLAADVTKNTAERIRALNSAIKVTKELFADERALQVERIRIAKIQLEASNSSTEDRAAFAEEQRKLIALDKQQADALKEIKPLCIQIIFTNSFFL